MMNPLSADHFLVDNSMLDLTTTCPYLGYVNIIKRLRPTTESPALRFGGAIHKALAYREKMHGFGKPWHESKMIATLEHFFAKHPLEVEGWRNFDNCVKAVRGYNAAYPKDQEHFDVEVNPLTGLPYVEQPFAIDTHRVVRGRKIIYVGRVDLKIRMPTKDKYVLDHKTSSVLGDAFWQDQSVTAQHRGYVWADREATGEECTGYIVDALGIRDSIQFAEFDERSGKLVPGLTNSGRQSKAVPFEPMRQRFFTKVPGGQIDEWFENMLMQVDLFLYCVDRCGDNPMLWERQRHRKHCVGKYGSCALFNVCSLTEQRQRDSALESSAFCENEWTPLYT